MIVRPQLPASEVGEASPRREASNRIVEIGQGYLLEREVDKAIQTFQKAINLDPENGVAYFYLARAQYEAKNFDEALGVLEKARVLLEQDETWRQEVEKLHSAILWAKERGDLPTQEEEPPVYY